MNRFRTHPSANGMPRDLVLQSRCSAVNKPVTMRTGPLGSTIHVLRADAETVAALAAVDWNRHFRQVCLDPVRGLITLMAPSNRHEDLTSVFDDLVEAAGLILAGAARKLRSPRLRGPDEPPGTGMEPDCAFYVGVRARRQKECGPARPRKSGRRRWPESYAGEVPYGCAKTPHPTPRLSRDRRAALHARRHYRVVRCHTRNTGMPCRPRGLVSAIE